MPRAAALVSLCLVVAFLPGCAGLGGLDEPPRVTLAGLRPVELQLLEQRFEARLRIRNPNDVPLRVRAMEYTLSINGGEFADGVRGEPFTVPAYGEEVVDLVMFSNLARVFDQFRRLQERDRPLVRYEVHGSLRLGGLGGRIAFEREGEIALSAPGEGEGGAAPGQPV